MGGAQPPLAEIGPRVVAFLIDFVAPPFAFYILLFVFAAISDTLGGLFALVGWLALLGFYIWQIVQEGSTGQTVGKKMQGIKLVGLENGYQPIGAVMVFVRNLINGVICNLGWLFPFFDAQRQTLGDKVTKSIVVPE